MPVLLIFLLTILLICLFTCLTGICTYFRLGELGDGLNYLNFWYLLKTCLVNILQAKLSKKKKA